MRSEDPNAGQNHAGDPPAESGKAAGQDAEPMRGASARVVENMEASLRIPTATSYRTIPVKLLEENRRIINEHLDAGGRL